MLTANQLRQVAAGSGARDIGNVEIDVILTYLLQIFSEKGVTDHVAFKGGTMLRKMVFGPRGRLAPESIEGARPAGSPGHAGTGPLLRYSPASGRRWPFRRALLRASNPAGGVLSILEQPRRLAHLLPNCLLSTRQAACSPTRRALGTPARDFWRLCRPFCPTSRILSPERAKAITWKTTN